MIIAGKLRHRVTIQRNQLGSPQRTNTGARNASWEDYITVYAAVDPINGREPFLAQQHFSEVTHKVRMRYHEGITTAMRLAWGSRRFDIKAVLNAEERRRELTLLCTEGVAQG